MKAVITVFMVYDYTDADTFESVAKYYGVSVQSILEINGISSPCKYRNIKQYYDSINPIGSFNQSYIFVPTIGNGGDTINIPSYDLITSNLGGTYWDTPETNYSPISLGCSIWVDGAGASFPCFPESVSETVSGSYNSQTPLGRQEPFYIYESSGPREVSVSFRMHREMFSSLSGLDNLINLIESGVYARSSGVPAKRVTLKIGGQVSISGVINGSVSVEWSETINAIPSVVGGWSGAKYNVATVSFSVVEVTGGNPTKA